MRSFAEHAGATLHLRVLRGPEPPPRHRGAFKALGLALRDAMAESGIGVQHSRARSVTGGEADAGAAHHRLPRREGRAGGEGRRVRGPARRGRSGGARRGATSRDGADEVTFLDISATPEERGTAPRRGPPHRRAALHPAHRGRRRAHGGRRGAGAAGGRGQGEHSTRRRCRGPRLLTECAGRFGAQCVVASIDARAIGRPLARGHARRQAGGGSGRGGVGARVPSGAARARSSSPASTATGRAPGTTWS